MLRNAQIRVLILSLSRTAANSLWRWIISDSPMRICMDANAGTRSANRRGAEGYQERYGQMKPGPKTFPVREAYVLRFGIPRTRKHILWLSAARLEQLGRWKSDECRRLILGTSK
jgi:hypothetical protein